MQQENGDDPFQEMDNEFQLSDLISQVVPTLITKYTEGGTSLPVSQFLLAACSSEAANNNVNDENDDDDVPYVGKFWRGKILANLANGWQFAKIFPTNIYKC